MREMMDGVVVAAAHAGRADKRKKFAMVCASNQNRSMEAHKVLLGEGFLVRSFGTGSSVKLPGPAIDQPNVYAFGTPYSKMYEELKSQNEALYRQNGVMEMLERNQKIKEAPERWQDATNVDCEVVITFEERVFEAVLDDFFTRQPTLFKAVYVINVETKDTHKDASVAGQNVLRLCRMLETSEDLEEDLERQCARFESETGMALLVSPHYY